MYSYNHFGCSCCGGPLNGGNCPGCSSVGSKNEFVYDQNPNSFDNHPDFSYQSPQPQYETYSCELCGNDAHYGYDYPPQFPLELAEYINTLSWNRLTFYNSGEDDDEEFSIPMSEIYKSSHTAIPPDLPITNSLIMEDEHLDTILKTKSDKLIKSSVENLVPNPSESEGLSEDLSKDLSDIESECNVPVGDDLITFSNSLFDADEKFSPSDDESFSDEDVPKENYSNPLFNEEIISIKIYPHHFNAESYLIESLLNQDSLIISSPKIDSLLVEFSGELAHINLIPPGINEADFDPEEEIRLVGKLLYDNSSPRLPEDFHANPNTIIESLPTFPIPVEDSDSLKEEIDIFLGSDDSVPPGIESDDYDSEGDDNSTSLPKFESFHVDYPDSGDSTIDVVEDIPVYVPNILPTYPSLHMDFDFIPSHNDLGSDLDVSSPSRDRNKIYDPGICIQVESTRFLATLSTVIDTLLPFSSKNKDKVFNHGVLASKDKSPPSSSHRGFKASKLFHHKIPMLIHGENTPNLGVRHLHFYPP
nr:hypothetical protein [Tanacetum cinerariifolium]